MITVYLSGKMTKEDLSITYENNIFYCTKNNTKWISVDGKKWYGEEKRIAELEKENAELRETVTKMNNVITETFSNLTKAKELLERLLITSCNSDVLNLLPNCSEVLRVRVEAEQFLNSEVKK